MKKKISQWRKKNCVWGALSASGQSCAPGGAGSCPPSGYTLLLSPLGQLGPDPRQESTHIHSWACCQTTGCSADTWWLSPPPARRPPGTRTWVCLRGESCCRSAYRRLGCLDPRTLLSQFLKGGEMSGSLRKHGERFQQFRKWTMVDFCIVSINSFNSSNIYLAEARKKYILQILEKSV